MHLFRAREAAAPAPFVFMTIFMSIRPNLYITNACLDGKCQTTDGLQRPLRSIQNLSSIWRHFTRLRSNLFFYNDWRHSAPSVLLSAPSGTLVRMPCDTIQKQATIWILCQWMSSRTDAPWLPRRHCLVSNGTVGIHSIRYTHSTVDAVQAGIWHLQRVQLLQ